MKGLIVLFFLSLCFMMNLVDNNDSGSIEYLITRNDFQRVGVLHFKSNVSHFVTNAIKSSEKKDLTEEVSKPTIDENQIMFVISDRKTGSLLSTEFLKNNKKVIVNDRIPELEWEFLPEKKKIGGFECQKARTFFRCSDYTAWFTTEIPLPIGPWKISGLPGVILELNNDTVGENYKAIKVELPSSSSLQEINTVKGFFKIYASFKDFGVDQRIELEKMKVFMRAQYNLPEDADIYIEERECY